MPAPALTRQRFLHYLLRSFAEALIVFCSAKALAGITLLRLPPGRAYVFETFGVGFWLDAAERIGLYTLAFVLYTIPCLSMRRTIGCTLRALMFFIIVVLIAYVDCRQYLAVIETPNTFECYRCIPFGHDSFPKKNLPHTTVTEKPLVRYLTFNNDPRYLVKPVWRQDAHANQTFDNLLDAIQKARH